MKKESVLHPLMEIKNDIESRIESARRWLDEFREACSFEKGGELTIAISDLNNLLAELKELQEDLIRKNTAVSTLAGSAEEERKRYREMFDFAPYCHLITSPDGVIKEFNRAASILLKTDRLAGRSVLDFFESKDVTRLMGSDIPPDAFKGIELLLSDSGGKRFPAFLSVDAIRDPQGEINGLRWFINDVTEKRRTEAQARQRQALLQGIMDNSRSVIFIKDTQGHYLMVNRQIEEMSGLRKEELIGKTNFDLFPHDIAQVLQANDQKVIETGAPQDFEERIIIRGTERIELSSKFPITGSDGRIIAVCGISTDITERKRAEEKNRYLNKILRTFYEINHLIIHETDRSRLLQRVCEIFVKTGGFRIAVISSVNGEAGKAVPVALAGIAGLPPDAFKACLKGSCRESPVSRVLDKGEQVICAGDKCAECMSAWGASELKDGCSSCAVYPVFVKGRVAGTLNLYSAEPNPFDGEVETMLARVAGNIGFALQAFDELETKREVEEALKKSEASLANAQRIAHLGSWELDMQTDDVSLSAESYRIFGMPYGSRLDFDVVMASVHPEDRPMILKSIEDALTGKTISADFRLIRQDGEVRFLHAEAEPYFDGEGKPLKLSGIVYDVTERRLAENALKQSKERLDNAQRIAHIGSWDWDIKTGRTHWSDETWRIYGLEKKEDTDHGLFRSLVHPEDRAAVFNAIREAVSGVARYNVDFRIIRPDGEVRRIHSEGEVIYDADGRPVSMSGVNHDITDMIRMEEEARYIQSKLIHANKMTSIGTLASGVAHEINNPNNFILFNSTLLSEAWSDAMGILKEYETEHGDFTLGGLPFTEMRAVVPELLSGITDGARRIKGIVDNLKDFSRADKSGMDGEFDVNRAVMASASILSAQIGKYTDNFYVTCAEDLPQVRGSAQKIEQVIINLIINALHSLPDRGCCVSVATLFDSRSRQVVLKVRDEGAGMSRDILERITEPFFTTKTDTGGTGLGLSISYTIIKEHSGSLEFESAPGKGTTVTVRLPAKKEKKEIAA